MSKPTVVILTAGASSRLFPINAQNKGYISLHGKSLISRTINSLLKKDFNDIVIVVPHTDPEGKNILALLQRDNINHQVKIATQASPKGQGDAILAAREYLKDDFIVVSPYYINAGEFAKKLWQRKESTDSKCVFLGTHTNTPQLFGIIEHSDEQLTGVIEKPKKGEEPSQMRILSFYLFSHKFLEFLSKTEKGEYSLEHAYSEFSTDNYCSWINVDTDVPTLKYPWHLFDFQQILFSKLKSYTDRSAIIANTAVIDDSNGPVYIGADAIIGHASRIVGPAFIGKGSVVGDFSLFRESSLEPEAVVGAHSEIARSIMMAQSTVHRAYLGDSIIGSDTKIGAGFITANRRNDRKEVEVIVKDKKVNSHRKNLGTIVGDHCRIGINSSTMPGVFIGPKTVVYPHQTIFEHVPKDSIVK